MNVFGGLGKRMSGNKSKRTVGELHYLTEKETSLVFFNIILQNWSNETLRFSRNRLFERL